MTLVELMLTLVIISIVTVGVLQVSVGFQRQYGVADLKRQASQNAQMAMTSIEHNLRLAGYGIEPALAFDFTVYKGGNGGIVDCTSPGTATASGCTRDSTTAPDELVFYARDPGYWGGDLQGQPEGKAWVFGGAAGPANGPYTMTITAHGGEVLHMGQILQIVCPGGSSSAYVTVQSKPNISGAGPVSVNINALVAGDPYQQSPLIPPCSGSGRVFMVNRFHYFIQNLDMGDGTQAPYLVLDQGVDWNDDGSIDSKDLIPVAAGIFDLQIGYERPSITGVPTLVAVDPTQPSLVYCDYTDWSTSTAPVGQDCNSGLGMRAVRFAIGAGQTGNPSNGFSYLNFQLTDSIRNSPDAGNIMAVEVGIVARSVGLLNRDVPKNTAPALLNRATSPTTYPYVFTTLTSVVRTRNMRTQSLSYL